MQPVLNIEDIKRVEVELTRVGVSVSELMHRAGYAAAQEVLELEGAKSVAVLCGMGNNGGDGWVAAEALLARGLKVQAVCPMDPDQISGDLARQVAQAAVKAGVPVTVGPSRDELDEVLDEADVVLDCMLGTGFHGEVRAPFDIWIECVNASGCRVVSVDVPSGLSAQTGQAGSACVVADLTVTMLALKPGLLADDGRDVCGAIVVAPLSEQTERLCVEADPVAWRTDLADYRDVMVEACSWWEAPLASRAPRSWPPAPPRAWAPATSRWPCRRLLRPCARRTCWRFPSWGFPATWRASSPPTLPSAWSRWPGAPRPCWWARACASPAAPWPW